MKRFSILALIAILFCSCTVTRVASLSESYCDEFEGKNISYILTICGEPSNTSDDGNKGKILLYNDVASFQANTGYMIDQNSSRPSYVQIFVDQNDICYAVRTNHTKTTKEFSNQKTWMCIASSVGGTMALTGIISLILNSIARK